MHEACDSPHRQKNLVMALLKKYSYTVMALLKKKQQTKNWQKTPNLTQPSLFTKCHKILPASHSIPKLENFIMRWEQYALYHCLLQWPSFSWAFSQVARSPPTGFCHSLYHSRVKKTPQMKWQPLYRHCSKPQSEAGLIRTISAWSNKLTDRFSHLLTIAG